MFCKYCGKEIKDDANFCPHCGRKLIMINEDIQYEEPKYSQDQEIDAFFEDKGNYWKGGNSYEEQTTQQEFSPSIGWCILAFLSPIAGFIVAFIFRHNRPKTARWCLILGLASWIISLLLVRAGVVGL